MKHLLWLISGFSGIAFLTGCQSLPPGAEPGPHGTMAYEVLIEATEPGAKIEANGEYVGDTPLRLKIYGDKDGTFHDFGSYNYVIRALPVVSNQFQQVRFFRTGRGFTPEDRIPQRITFDMNKQTPVYAPTGYGDEPVYYPPPPVYFGPGYYGPSMRFYIGPRFHHRRW
jgi:hypothetical protein